jgi:tripartite-type tricarboxylate transporter receptor subunit TctC
VRIVVGLAPGGTNDIVARIVGQYLSDHLGQLCSAVVNQIGNIVRL